jgi:hypothetical protein
MRIIETEVYTFDELSDDVKENVKIDLMSEYFYEAEAIDSLYAFAREIGVDIINYSIDWANVWNCDIKWRWSNLDIYKNDLTTDSLTGYCMDIPLIDEWNRTKDVDDSIDKWIRECNEDYEHQFSDEYVSEHCEANEYEFTKDGKLV